MKKLLIMVRKNIIYIIPLILVLAAFALLPEKNELESFEPALEMPEFILETPISDTIKVLKPERKNKEETRLITALLQNHHFRKLPLNDSVSGVIYDNYLSSLDNNKMYFIKKDIEAFDSYKTHIDDYLMAGDLNAPYQIFAVFKERYYERIAAVRKMLKKNKFNFSIDEEFVFDREKSDWAENDKALNEVWRKYIKNELLNLKLTGKSTEEAIDVLNKRYDRYQTVIQQYKSEDVYQVFMNSYTEVFDPHTNYFNPITAENFNIEMSKSLEGIGARLTKDGDYTVVVSVVPGGPAFKSNQIHDNDKIVGVGQDEDGEIVDVVGWRNDDVVQLIRGKKGTTVRLSILKAEDGATAIPKIVVLVRDKINIEDTRAESKVYEFLYDGGEFKLGVITIPSFYKDFKEAHDGIDNFNSTTRDVRKLITDLKEQGVDGVMIDLRRNGGGALDEAVELTGLFIKEGPVVQIKDTYGKTIRRDDEDSEVFYNGPLAVLTSRLSASASEIFAAALKDYKRALVVGEQTFGKGTVQDLVALQPYIKAEKEKLGHLKLTRAKFYRINGGSTQNIGVTPDLKLPSIYDKTVVGESAYPSALPWDKIKSSKYKLADNISIDLIAALQSKYDQRLETDLDLKDLVADTKRMRENQLRTSVSLNEEQRKKEQEEDEKRRNPHPEVEGEIVTPESGEVKTGNLKLKDIYLQEGLFVLADMIAYRDS
ncbi:MAG: carboxy terminal-processing peptidase [Bacteroidota bacterium]